MNILHVLSQFEVTGAETYAAVLADFQVRTGHSVTIVSDTFHTATEAEIYTLPIGIRTYSQKLRNISAIRELLRIKKIDVIHAHSRAASWVSHRAARGSDVPLVSTIHGRQHVHFSSKTFHIYGEKIIAVCEEIREHLISDLHFSPESIAVVRNGIDVLQWPFKPDIRREKTAIALVGRLSGPKGEVARHIIAEVFPRIVQKIPNIELWVVGGMKETEEIHRLILDANAAIGSEKIIFRGFLKNIVEVYHQASIVIGSGRVAIEALACGNQVIAIGESSYIGLVCAETEQQALKTNFGDAGRPEPINYSIIEHDILSVLTENNRNTAEWGRTFIEREFALEAVTPRISSIYFEAMIDKTKKREIPVLMYHRVTEGVPPRTKYGIYVTTSEFEQQLSFLERKRFTTLTYYDLAKIFALRQPLPRNPVILTFDDGYEDNFLNAFPILQRHSMKAVIFLLGNRSITSNVWDMQNGEPEVNLLNDEQIRLMAEYGIEFGSHSMDHRRLTELSVEEAQNDVTASKLLLEKRLGKEIISFAYPYGAINEQVKECICRAGYEFGIATDSGPWNFWSDLFQIRRIPIFPGTGLFTYWKKISGWYNRYKEIKETLRLAHPESLDKPSA
ncbi:MAG: polysaccharide deacetylase family protein [Bacteroidota bacterium]